METCSKLLASVKEKIDFVFGICAKHFNGKHQFLRKKKMTSWPKLGQNIFRNFTLSVEGFLLNVKVMSGSVKHIKDCAFVFLRGRSAPVAQC